MDRGAIIFQDGKDGGNVARPILYRLLEARWPGQYAMEGHLLAQPYLDGVFALDVDLSRSGLSWWIDGQVSL